MTHTPHGIFGPALLGYDQTKNCQAYSEDKVSPFDTLLDPMNSNFLPKSGIGRERLACFPLSPDGDLVTSRQVV